MNRATVFARARRELTGRARVVGGLTDIYFDSQVDGDARDVVSSLVEDLRKLVRGRNNLTVMLLRDAHVDGFAGAYEPANAWGDDGSEARILASAGWRVRKMSAKTKTGWSRSPLRGATQDMQRADLAFTVLHEVGHYLQEEDGSDTDDHAGCDRFAARCLKLLRPGLYEAYAGVLPSVVSGDSAGWGDLPTARRSAKKGERG